MKALPLSMTDKMLLNARNMAETIIGHIKAFSSLNLPKHRAPINAFLHLLAAIRSAPSTSRSAFPPSPWQSEKLPIDGASTLSVAAAATKGARQIHVILHAKDLLDDCKHPLDALERLGPYWEKAVRDLHRQARIVLNSSFNLKLSTIYILLSKV
jgi:hypothetical protein